MSNKRPINLNLNLPSKKVKAQADNKNKSSTNALGEYIVQAQDPSQPVSPLVTLFSDSSYMGYEKFFWVNLRKWLEDREIEVVSSLCKRFRQIIPRFIRDLTRYCSPTVDISNSLLYSMWYVYSENYLKQWLVAIGKLKKERPRSIVQVTSADIRLKDSMENLVSMIGQLHSEKIRADISLEIYSKEQLMAIVAQLNKVASMDPKPHARIWEVVVFPEAYKDADELQAILKNLPIDINYLSIKGRHSPGMTLLNLNRFPSLRQLVLETH